MSGDSTRPGHQTGFKTRAISGLNGPAAAEWGRRNGLGARLPFSHNLTSVFPPDLARTRPEFFPLENGRRLEPPPGSYFWNPDIARPDVARYAAEAARNHFIAHPEAVSFALGVNDALIWGESPELIDLVGTPGAKIGDQGSGGGMRWFRERPDYSNLVFTFMNRAAAELARTHPDKYLGALAYYWCENTPDFPLHPQVIPFLTADRSQGYDPAFWAEEMALQERWGRLAGEQVPDAGGPGRRLGMYDYLYGVGFLIPRIHTKLLAANLRHARSAGFTDYYAEIAPNWGLDPITPWLTAQLLLDPGQSESGLLDEFHRRYFQEAEVPMRRFFERCEAQWMNQPGPSYWLKHFRNESQAAVFPSKVCAELRILLEEARRMARSAKVRARVELVSDTFGVTERFVDFKERRDAVIRASLTIASQGKGETSSAGSRTGAEQTDFLGGLPAALEACLEARSEFIGYTVRLLQARPLALHPFGWGDYLKNDPVPLAVMAIHTAMALRPVSEGPAILKDPRVAPLQQASLRTAPDTGGVSVGVELLRNPTMSGPPAPPRTIAGLKYSVPLPPEWQSRVEPAEHHSAELSGGALRLSGTKDTMLSQWTATAGEVPGGPAPSQVGQIRVRGRVSPGTAVSLILAWLDGNHRHLGFKTVRLPDGEWPEFVPLVQAGMQPTGAAWVGLGLRVQNQVAGDWLEAGGFSLRRE